MKYIQRIFILTLFISLLWITAVPASGESVACNYNPLVAALLSQSSLDLWLSWVSNLSGEQPVELDNFPFLIQTRNTGKMFRGDSNARGYDYVLKQVNAWFPAEHIEEQVFAYGELSARNLIVTIPGQTKPDEYVLLTAHLDDTSWNSTIAPGANDNALGAATLLEAARLFRQLRFERSLRLIWFTGEEAGLIGSKAYVVQYPNLNYQGVINLDMFGWDGDGDHCFEIHVGTLPASQTIGACLVDTLAAYSHTLSFDYVTNGATGASDHASFWSSGIGAIALLENYTDQNLTGGCVGKDMNPYYHKREDTIALNLTSPYAYEIAQAALESAAALAKPTEPCFTETPFTSLFIDPPETAHLSWNTVESAATYRLYRSSFGCTGNWERLGDTSETIWTDIPIRIDWPYQYQIEAVTADGVCVSPPSACLMAGPPPPPAYDQVFLSLITR